MLDGMQKILRSYSIGLLIFICSTMPAMSEVWPKGKGCGFANLGGCRASIKSGERFSSPRAYGFRNASDLAAWRAKKTEKRSELGENSIQFNQNNGTFKIDADVVLIARQYMSVCCPGNDFEGVAEHPQLGEIYIISGPDF